MTIAEINALLDDLGGSYVYGADKQPAASLETRRRVLSEFVRRLPASQHNWLVRIILKDLRFHMTEDTLLELFHPDAKKMFSECCDLKKVCDTLLDPGERSHGSDIALGSPFKPMLSQRADMGIEKLFKKIGPAGFLAETKYDGERFQLHKVCVCQNESPRSC